MNDAEHQRCMSVLTAVHGLHNWRHYTTKAGIVRTPFNVEVTYRGDMATFDADELTRLVIAAHKHRVRVGIHGSSRGHMKIYLHPRSETGSSMERHPGPERLAEATS